MHRKVIFYKASIYKRLFLLFNYINNKNCVIISYFGAVLFPVYLLTKRAILEVARRASSRLFSRIFSRDKHGLLVNKASIKSNKYFNTWFKV